MSASTRRPPRIMATALAACAWFLVQPASAQPGGLANGQRIYQSHCAGCHGVSGIAVMPQAHHFARGERLNQPDPVLVNSIKMGRAVMPAFIGILNDRDILDVLSFLRTMRR